MKVSSLVGTWLLSRSTTAAPRWNSYYPRDNPTVDIYGLLTASNNSWDASTTISSPNTTTFTDATLRWSVFSEPTYVAAISPGTEADVARAVQIATAANVPFLATSGRHGIADSLRTLQSGLAIDLSHLNSVVVDKEAATVAIGGGIRFRDLYTPLGDDDFMIQTGSGSCPGMMGAGLGAGVGRYQGMFGLVIDALVSARVVTSAGEVVDASAEQNPDLFWAIRGAGHNFGIVTSAVFNVHQTPNNNQILNVDFILPAASNGTYFDILHTLENMPPELATISFVMWNDTSKEPEILANWVYTGPEEEGLKLMEPVFALNPIRSESTVVPWSKLVTTAGFGADSLWCAPSIEPRTQLSTNTKLLNADTMRTMFEKMTNFYNEVPEARGSTIELEIFNSDAMKAIPDDSTAYPWRDSIAYTMYELTWSSDEGEAAALALGEDLRNDFVATSGYDDVSVYVNYAKGDETVEQKYGKNKLPRLAELKKKWDPNQVFGYSNPIPTQYP